MGFAAEHGEGGVERGRGKLERKGLDAVVVNDIARPDIGFDSEQNEVTIVTAAGERAGAAGPEGGGGRGHTRRRGAAAERERASPTTVEGEQ